MPETQDYLSNSKGGSTAPRKKSVVVSVLFFLLIFLLILAGVLAYFLRRAQRSAELQTVEYQMEKDSILHQMQAQVYAFDSLQSSSEEVRTRLQLEKSKAEALVAKIQSEQQVTFQQLKSYQRELGTLREIMRNMVREIDSLNSVNRELVEENTRMRGSFAESQQEVRRLTTSNEELSTAVMLGSVVKARNIQIIAIDKKGKEVNKARRAAKLRTDFTLSENTLAKPGLREIYIRLTDKDGVLLASSDGATFKFGGQNMPCSAHREIDYQNQELDINIFYGDSGSFAAGEYHVSVFMDETRIGEGSVVLK